MRAAVRSLRRHRGLALAAASTLGLGIGAALTMAGVVDEVLLRPLPVREENRIAVAWGVFQTSSFGHVPLSYRTMKAVGERTRVFERVAAVDYNGIWSVVGRVGDRAEPLRLGVVAGDFFATLGVAPVLGRLLTAADDLPGGAPYAVISRGLWQRRFAGDSTVVGKTLPIWTDNYTIVGVVPDDLELPQGAEAWVSLGAIRPDVLDDPTYGTLDLVGRLRPGQTLADASAELDRLILEASGEQWVTDSRLVSSVHSLRDVLVGRVRPALLVLGSAALLVFLVAVLNLGNLLVVRGVERRQEFAIRRAIGASRASLIRQIVAESAVLVALGGAAGVLLAWLGWQAIPALAPEDIPRLGPISLRLPVLLAGLALGVVAVAIVSALPALSLNEASLRLPMGSGAPSGGRPSRVSAWAAVVGAQVALAVVTLIASLLLVRTLSQLQRIEPGFEPDDLVILQVAYLSTALETGEQFTAMMTRVVDRVKSVPGVEGATVALNPPFPGTGGADFGFIAEGQTPADAAGNPYLNYEVVSPGYFATLETPILLGRAFSEADRAGSPRVVVVNRTLARRMWPGQNPVGKRIRWADSASAGEWRTVVGVAADTRYRDLLEIRPSVYVPVGQENFPPAFLVVRAPRTLAGLVPALRQAVRELDPDLDVVNASSMNALLARPLAGPRFNAGVLLAFALTAVLLAATGLYGLTRFVVAQRRREVGIRLAVGARPQQIVRLFLQRGMIPVAAGSAAGVAIALVGGRVLTSLVYGVTTSDSLAILAAVAGFASIAFGAILTATRGAAGRDPMAVLRPE